jgi:hypothetical protein
MAVIVRSGHAAGASSPRPASTKAKIKKTPATSSEICATLFTRNSSLAHCLTRDAKQIVELHRHIADVNADSEFDMFFDRDAGAASADAAWWRIAL